MKAKAKNEVEHAEYDAKQQRYVHERSKSIKIAIAHYMNIQMYIHAKSLEVFAKLHFDL